MTPLKILSTMALHAVLDDIAPSYEKRTGLVLQVEYEATLKLLARIRAGDRADAAFLTAQAIAELEGEGVLAAGGRVDLARSNIGLAVKQGAPLPDVSSVEAFERTLLQAKSVAYSEMGASGVYFKSLLVRMGIADKINARVLAKGLTGEPVARGEVEIAVQQVSELIQVPGITIVRELPAEVQQTTIFSAAAFAQTQSAGAVNDLIAFLRSAEMAPVLIRYGFEPLHESA
jgi:molybdate transport system substrate-binding protein